MAKSKANQTIARFHVYCLNYVLNIMTLESCALLDLNNVLKRYVKENLFPYQKSMS